MTQLGDEYYMAHRHLTEHLDRYRNYFPGPHLDLVLDSMSAGNTLGEFWSVPQEPAPPLLLLWDRGNNVLYLAGDVHEESSLRSLAEVITTEVRPAALTKGAARFKTRPLSASLEQSLPSLFPDVVLRSTSVLFFTHDFSRHIPAAPAGVADVTVVPITPDVLHSGGLAYSAHVLNEIRSMWPAEERFYEAGFGTLAVREDEIICWCTAEYVSRNRCGIGIETSPRYERRGVATATAGRFVEVARERSITPCWECNAANMGSIRVAEKVGFARQTEEVYWVGSFDEESGSQ
jgi:GNAT superfamily N-acetyltransferase